MRKKVFNLTAYCGMGEGYVASAEYTFENDENGELIMLANQEGIKIL